MKKLTVPAIKQETFGLEVMPVSPPRFRFWGTGDTDAIPALERFLRQVHDEMTAYGASSIGVDLGELYIMNSSCMKQFISWIYKVESGGRPYTICFWLAPRLRWQTRTVDTFRRMAPETVEIREVSSVPPPAMAY